MSFQSPASGELNHQFRKASIHVPLAAFTMALVLGTYCVVSIRSARRNAKYSSITDNKPHNHNHSHMRTHTPPDSHIIASSVPASTPSPSPSPTPSPTLSPAPTPANTPANTPTPTNTPIPSPIPTPVAPVDETIDKHAAVVAGADAPAHHTPIPDAAAAPSWIITALEKKGGDGKK
ncbi:hypothetical protein FQN53_006603 [Emmonsiellopsis sp. PD_33]|nr:hypothetical protein FQN53_006603 [Emmonsiellopsis sp. PD_33]